jgi:CheY-like chemotaxis protein
MSEVLTAERSAVRRTAPVEMPLSLHVLVAGSNARTRDARERQLRSAGHRVSLARTSFEAIVKACCQMPDLILLDIDLSDIDATETGQLLTTCPLTAHIPVVRLLPGRRIPHRILSGLDRARC